MATAALFRLGKLDSLALGPGYCDFSRSGRSPDLFEGGKLPSLPLFIWGVA
jgi:hypothetical protein